MNAVGAPLRYHARAFDLIGIAPAISPTAAADVSGIERRIGRPLPQSFHEFYSIQGVCDLLMQYSNGDPPVPIDKLGADGLVADELLIFRYENQNVCVWAVWINGEEDPPVVVTQDHTFKSYTFCADRFSDHINCCFWDYGHVFNGPLIQSQNGPISATALAFLRRTYSERISTKGWPGDVQHRFESNDQQILIWETTGQQADWWISADSEEALEAVVRQFWDVDDLSLTLWSTDEIGNQVIDRVRDSIRPGTLHGRSWDDIAGKS